MNCCRKTSEVVFESTPPKKARPEIYRLTHMAYGLTDGRVTHIAVTGTSDRLRERGCELLRAFHVAVDFTALGRHDRVIASWKTGANVSKVRDDRYIAYIENIAAEEAEHLGNAQKVQVLLSPPAVFVGHRGDFPTGTLRSALRHSATLNNPAVMRLEKDIWGAAVASPVSQ